MIGKWARPDMMEPIFFPRPSELRKWFEKNHQKAEEIWVGYYKKHTGQPSITWPQSVDQALCFGWIDGLRKSIDESSYKIRFTPRRLGSNWSEVNLKRIKELRKVGLLTKTGLSIYNKRDKKKIKQLSIQRKNVALDHAYLENLMAVKKAWNFYETLAPSYKKAVGLWIMTAKREETRLRRLDILIQSCLEKRKVPPLRRNNE